MEYLQNGVSVRYFVEGEERNSIVYLIDYQSVNRNDFYAVNQFTYIENGNQRRPDIVDHAGFAVQFRLADGVLDRLGIGAAVGLDHWLGNTHQRRAAVFGIIHLAAQLVHAALNHQVAHLGLGAF